VRNVQLQADWNRAERFGVRRILAFLNAVIPVVFLFLAVSAVVTNGANAQTLYGSIVGTVTDTSGALVPDAAVKATQTQTNETRIAATNGAGVYALWTLPAGTYVVSISKSGFSNFEVDDIELIINTTVRVDAKLKVGARSETVRVSSDNVDLQTDRADVHGVVSADDLQQLPQPTRTYEGLIGLLPGVTPPKANSGGTNNPIRSMEVNVNGTSANGTNVSIDGVSATNAWVQFYSTAVPSTEAIEAVNVVTASPSADQGAMSGAGIRVQIRTGTNSFHGSAYWYNENNNSRPNRTFNQSAKKNRSTLTTMRGARSAAQSLKTSCFSLVAMRETFCAKLRGVTTLCRPPIWPAESLLRRHRFSIRQQEIQTAAEELPFRRILQATTSSLRIESARFHKC
jgi:hypothetical protein